MAGPAAIAPPAQGTRIVPAPRPGQISPVQAGAIGPMSLLRALRRRAALALGIALLLAGIAGPAAWYFIPLSFKAQATLQVSAQPPRILFPTLDAQVFNGDEYKRFQSTQKDLLKSQMVLRAAILKPEVAQCVLIKEQVDPVEWLQQKLDVEFSTGSELMVISLSGDDPRELAIIVNAVKRAYMDEVVDIDARRRIDRHEHLKKLKDHYTQLLKEKRALMKKLAQSLGSNDHATIALKQQYTIEHRQALTRQLEDVQSQKRTWEAQLKTMSPVAEGGTEPPPLSEAEIEQLVEQHPDVADLVAQVAEQEQTYDREYAKLRRVSRHAAADPALQNLASEMKATRKRLAQRRKEIRPEVQRKASEPGGVLAATGGQDINRELAMLADLENTLNKEIDNIDAGNKKVANDTLDLQENQEEIAQMQATSDKISMEIEQLNVELQAAPRIKTIDDATPPRTKDQKKRIMMTCVVTFGSFFGSLFGIAFLELQTRKVDTADEVPLELGLTVVGALPILPPRNQKGGEIAERETEKDRLWRNVLLESVDATRTMLLHAARTGSYRVLMVGSAVGGEGKTSLASYLATSMARTGLRTLLIDADLRSPMMHRLFDVPQGPGLSEVLRGEADLDAGLAATAVEDLKILAAGQCDRQAIRILSQGGLDPIFGRLKEQFDFIIVDSSPILPVADAAMIAQHADAVLFSIFRDVSSKTKVKAAFDRLQRLGVPVLGAVVTGAHGGLYGNSYYGSGASYPGLPESVAASIQMPSEA